MVHASPKILDGRSSDPPSPLYDSSVERVTSKGNPKTRNSPPNPISYVIADLVSDPSLLGSSLTELSNSSDDKHFK